MALSLFSHHKSSLRKFLFNLDTFLILTVVLLLSYSDAFSQVIVDDSDLYISKEDFESIKSLIRRDFANYNTARLSLLVKTNNGWVCGKISVDGLTGRNHEFWPFISLPQAETLIVAQPIQEDDAENVLKAKRHLLEKFISVCSNATRI